jgi:hypothetical protein
MPVSEAKLRANRMNAQKSSGPRTETGKAASSRNAMTHGIFCRDLLVLNENAEDLQSLKQDAVQRMSPRDGVELQLVEQWVGNCWKLKRVESAEKRAFDELAGKIARSNRTEKELYHKLDSNLPDPQDATHAMRKLLEDGTLDKYQRYQQRLFNNMLRCMRELRQLKKEESETPVPEVRDSAAPNEPTADEPTTSQNEPTAPAAKNPQNEPTDPPKPKLELNLPPSLVNEPTPRAARLNAAVEAALPRLPDWLTKTVK